MKIVEYSFPEIDYVVCPHCGEEMSVSGDEFEKSLSMDLYATSSPECNHCKEQFVVNIGGW